MEDNRTLLRKAEMAVSDLSSGGYLSAEQLSEYIRLAIKKPFMLQKCHVFTMKAPKQDMPTIQFSGQVLRPGTEGTPLPSGEWASPTLAMPQLDVQTFRTEIVLSDEVLEDQIEHEGFRETLMSGLAEATGRDMEKVMIQGDTTSDDPLLAKLDGILKQADTYVVNAGSIALDKSIFKALEKALPDEFADSGNLAFYTNRQARLDYKDSLSDRATDLGDVVLQLGNKPLTYGEYPIYSVPMFPVASNLTNVLFGDAHMIKVGVYRQIKMKVGEDISAGLVKVVGTTRFDVKLANAGMFPKATHVTGV